jgi:hypothetical protein
MNQVQQWLKRAEEFLDEWGRGAWIAAFVLGFILFWPLGLVILFYAIWSGRMGCWKHKSRFARRHSSGNSAFDDYREETLRRLEEEQGEFEGFLEKLRRAKDKAEFDQFMKERKTPPHGGDPQPA